MSLIEFDRSFRHGPGGACDGCPIRHRAICALCSPDELAILDRVKSYRQVSAGQTVIHAGDSPSHVATVVTGVATLARSLEDGRRQIVGILFPSDFIGRPGRDRAAFDVVATTDLLLCRFDRAGFEGILDTTPHVANRLLQMTLDELDAARDWSVVLGRMTAREKMAAFLLILARRIGTEEEGGIVLTMPLTREAIADHLGLTIETASRQISAFRREGLVRTTGRTLLSIPDLDRLKAEVGD